MWKAQFVDLSASRMSPAVERNFGHLEPKERIRQAKQLRLIADELEASAEVLSRAHSVLPRADRGGGC